MTQINFDCRDNANVRASPTKIDADQLRFGNMLLLYQLRRLDHWHPSRFPPRSSGMDGRWNDMLEDERIWRQLWDPLRTCRPGMLQQHGPSLFAPDQVAKTEPTGSLPKRLAGLLA